MSVKIVGSWKNDEQREMLLVIWKIMNWFLKQEKAVNNKTCEKFKKKEKEKKKRKRKKSKQKKPVTL